MKGFTFWKNFVAASVLSIFLANTGMAATDVFTPGSSPIPNQTFREITTPTSPASSHDKLYFKSGGKLYKLNSAGTELELTDKAYVDGIIVGASGLTYKGATACNTNPNYPAANAGDLYKVSVAGRIGGASGIVVTAGDMFLCTTTAVTGDQATVGSSWNVIQANIDLTNITITGGSITGITDLTVADGGTGVSTLAAGGILVGVDASPVGVVAPGTTSQILVGGGAATNPVWTTATGSGAPVRATSPVLTTPNIGSATGSVSGNAGTVTNATLTTALTVNTGTVTLTGNSANTSAVTLGAGASSVSGANTGDVTLATTNHGLGLTNQVITLGTPSSVTGASTNAVTTTTHTHAIDLTAPPAIGGTTPAAGTFSTLSLSTGYLSTTKTAGTTGTTANLLVKIDSTGNVVDAALSDVSILGIAASTKTTGQDVEIATRGIMNCVADNTTIIGNLAIVGTSTAGRCRDSGQTNSTFIPIGTQIVGKFLSVATVGNDASLQLYGPGHYGAWSVQKGPVIITTFAGTVSTSGSSTTITFTSAADAILAGYNATNPILGTTLITTAVNQASVTRYVVSWTNATACEVDSACTLAASSTLASVQLPIATFVNSAGVGSGVWNAVGNVGIGTTNPMLKFETLTGGGNLPATTGTAQSTGGAIRVSVTGGTSVLDIGSAGTTGAWLQATRSDALSINYPLLLNPNGGNIGIGTTGPVAPLHIYSSNVTTGFATHGNLSVMTNTAYGANIGGSITLGGLTDAANQRVFGSIEGRKENATISNMAGYLSFKTNSNVNPFLIEAMRIDSQGNVGIGTTNFGTSAVKVLAMGSGTAPSTSPLDAAQLWVQDIVAGKAAFHMRDEAGNTGPIGFKVEPEITVASSATLDLSQVNGKFINNNAQTTDTIYTLPAAAANLAFGFGASTTVAKYLRIAPNAADYINLDGVIPAVNKYIQFASIAEGNSFSCRTYYASAVSKYNWMCKTGSGSLLSE